MADHDYMVSLERIEQDGALNYKALVASCSEKLDRFDFQTDDYNKAYNKARSYHSFLTSKYPNKKIAAYIEMPLQGAQYSSYGVFPSESIDLDKEFYLPMAHEFHEIGSRVSSPNYNAVFRTVVASNRLNLFQESEFLRYLKQKHIVEYKDER